MKASKEEEGAEEAALQAAGDTQAGKGPAANVEAEAGVNACEAWLAPDQAVRVTLLEPREVHLMAVIAALTLKEVGVLIERSVPPGAPVHVETGTMMLAGTVQYCRPEGSGFAAGLTLEPQRTIDGKLNSLVQEEVRLDCAG